MTPRPSTRASTVGFSLIELLIVLFTASAVAALIIIGGKRAVARAQITRAQTELERIGNLLLDHRLREGAYPTSLTSLTGTFGATLTLDANGHPIDPWKMRYCYTNATAESYTLYSTGPDPTNATDDIREGQ